MAAISCFIIIIIIIITTTTTTIIIVVVVITVIHPHFLLHKQATDGADVADNITIS
jgi:hypothetical protein